MLKQDFVDRMQLSPCYLKMPIDKNNQPEQEIDKLVAQLPRVKEKYDWRYFPSELRPKVLAKKIKCKPDDMKNLDINKKLEQLEKLEEKSVERVEKVEETEEIEEEVMEEEQDEEMDDGTDYANNYFDNGEDYEDEDDTLDDGPIY